MIEEVEVGLCLGGEIMFVCLFVMRARSRDPFLKTARILISALDLSGITGHIEEFFLS